MPVLRHAPPAAEHHGLRRRFLIIRGEGDRQVWGA